ncbi:MAG TPA: hypothetical protein VFV41_04815 [Streptosporangiaceae bacterium]|nr:hypothetical protein [Streptosporangiaceae bacterium]
MIEQHPAQRLILGARHANRPVRQLACEPADVCDFRPGILE